MHAKRILYLHGLASSPLSHKAQFFGARLAELGLEMALPDLNEGDFRGLTTSRAVRLAVRVARELEPPILVFGSSFGGRVAARVAEQLPERVVGAVLMAPAFVFANATLRTRGQEGLAGWQETGALMVDHPAYAKEVPLGYGFYKDALATDGFPALPSGLETLIFHGRGDEVVPFTDTEQFAARHPGARLVPLDSDHELNDRHDEMWRETEPFVRRHLGAFVL